MKLDWLIGEYNNFQQYWQENTEEEIHRVDTAHRHHHRHLECIAGDNGLSVVLKLYDGRAKENLISTHIVKLDNGAATLDGKPIDVKKNSIELPSGFLKNNNGNLRFSGMEILEGCNETPYIFIKCRYFSGWIQYPPDIKDPDELYSLRDLEIHDQGGYVELDVDGVDYTVELTQLVYAKTLKIMKLAIYDLPKSEVDINSKAICYTWAEPEATRLGINIRKVISGWTLIEPGFINLNNLNKNS